MKTPQNSGATEGCAPPPYSAWRPIETAPRNQVVLVNDTTGTAPWAAARWCETEEWRGWIYDDAAAADCMPLGPMPTHWMIPPSVPNVKSAATGSERNENE